VKERGVPSQGGRATIVRVKFARAGDASRAAACARRS
jgi:hypothetical protein